MKKYLLLGVFSWWMACGAQTYDYIPLPDPNFVWKGYYTCAAQGRGWTEDWIFELTKDSLINNLTYHGIEYQTGYLWWLREDSTHKVYLIWPSIPQERLLYDFSLQVGDTVV